MLFRSVEAWKPHIVFNQLVEFRDVAAYQVHVVSYLELLGVPYTGCNPRGILLARDKALAKQIFRYHRIPTPDFAVVRLGQRPRIPRSLGFPLIVKSTEEEASLGLSQASVVHDPDELRERVGELQGPGRLRLRRGGLRRGLWLRCGQIGRAHV